MEMSIIEDRIQQYNPENKQEELNALKEISQEITLMSLSRASFFKQGAFQGGTCLRVLHDLPRFSEDLDFILYDSNPNFKWQAFTNEIILEFESYGLSIEIKDRSEVPGTVKKAFLKDNSFGKILNLNYERNRADTQSIIIKLEIDTHPPFGSTFENQFIEFPSPFTVVTQTTPSLFSGKLHALLCRKYIKGRDWYDFTWYIIRKAPVNFELLKNSLYQQGPWNQKSLPINKEWLIENLKIKIESIDWKAVKEDVRNFIKPREHHSLELWNKDFFLHFTKKLQEYL